ncbi:histidine phosphatase family protein [Tsukamurella pseudospumae]|uniref:Histidine phosphatase n=1 Tax=Tsukamurella pseudospumae TaxID=239498 RepID=A0A138A8G3_9ACTN|nr:histidine phosphatase family protein [Tsukamurella pseudospumae]KXP00606.1 histidine phosphatase [Tsukamurella pseudospumae]KXP06627.1 histidine phosphatase [Tsukamurella pseudospumae]
MHVEDGLDSSVERLTPTVRRLILLRHGQTASNAEGRMQGQLDTDLTELGRRQARAAAAALADRDPIAIISSDLRRARDTADAVAAATGGTVESDVRLRETMLGDWQGMTHVEVDAYMPGARRRWRDAPEWAPPGGEARVDVAARSYPLVTELMERLPEWGTSERPVMLVAHGGLIAALTARLLDLPVDHWPVLGGLGNCSWVQLSAHGDATRWRLDVWNTSSDVDTAPQSVPEVQ